MKFGITDLFHRHNQPEWKIRRDLVLLHMEKQKIKEKERKLLKKLEDIKS